MDANNNDNTLHVTDRKTGVTIKIPMTSNNCNGNNKNLYDVPKLDRDLELRKLQELYRWYHLYFSGADCAEHHALFERMLAHEKWWIYQNTNTTIEQPSMDFNWSTLDNSEARTRRWNVRMQKEQAKNWVAFQQRAVENKKAYDEYWRKEREKAHINP